MKPSNDHPKGKLAPVKEKGKTMTEQPCAACGGTGLGADGRRCKACHGLGTVRVWR